jgi:tetratricopeptide (TPR) repeat protein
MTLKIGQNKPQITRGSLALGAIILASALFLSGCSEKVVYNRSVAELNQKAMALLQQGNTAGAVGRLESAIDLYPDEPNTLHNLAVAYQANGELDKSIVTFERLLSFPEIPDVDKVKKSLGVVYEEKADALYVKAEEAEDEKKQDEASRLKQDALAYYQKAIELYTEVLQIKPDQAMESHIDILGKKLEEEATP